MPQHPVLRWLLYIAGSLAALALLGIATLGIAAAFAYPKLPSLDALTDYRPHIPLRVYTADGALIGEFGEERRTFVAYREVPENLVRAILAAEDDRFFQHRGVDLAGLVRATVLNVVGGGRRQGGSTITMQVARNFYLSREKTLSRKLYEILLALKIEKSLSKEQILEIYINQIYLGQRAYGFAAAAQTYYGKPLKELSPADLAMLAGLPKAPSAYNPATNPERATLRQRYVLRRMHELGWLDTAAYTAAQKAPLKLAIGRNQPGVHATITVHAEYVAEMARQMAFEHFKEETYTRGIKVVTTLLRTDQETAYEALRRGVIDYDQRHGYRGVEGFVDLSQISSDQDEALEELLEKHPDHGDALAGIVLGASRQEIRVYLRGGQIIKITGPALRFVNAMLSEKAPPAKRVRRGAVLRVTKGPKEWFVTQTPEVEGAFLSLDPNSGAIRALVGGYDFNRNKFNHVTQAWRQPGSSFKPFIFSAAIEKGYTPGTMMDDAPLTFTAEQTGSQEWAPQNYDGKFDGRMPLRTALAKSKNMVAISLLQAIGTTYAQDYVTSRFGFDHARIPPYLTMALGAGSVTPWQMASAYSVFANGGYRVQPFVVSEIRDENNKIVARYTPTPRDEAQRVIDPRNAYLMDLMMKDVIRAGTATRALTLKRSDIAGKTGTTNEYVDAWFCGYQPNLVGISWIGFDQPRKLGSGETGGALALPVWIGYMQKILNGVPETQIAPPPGLVATQSPETGEYDLLYAEHLPAPPSDPAAGQSAPAHEPDSED